MANIADDGGQAQNRRGFVREQPCYWRAEFFALPNSFKFIFETSGGFLGLVV